MFRLGYTDKLASPSSVQGNDPLVRGSIDEIATQAEVGVQELETAFLVHGAHADVGPFLANAHRTELKGRDMHASTRGEKSVLSEFRGRWRCTRHHFLSNPWSVGLFICNLLFSLMYHITSDEDPSAETRRVAASL